jgi:hypothetical protein
MASRAKIPGWNKNGGEDRENFRQVANAWVANGVKSAEEPKL